MDSWYYTRKYSVDTIKPGLFVVLKIIIIGNFLTYVTAGVVEGTIGSDGDQTTEGSMSISLPHALFNGISAGDARVSFTAYTTAALFPLASDPSRSDRFELGSPVIGVILTGREVSSLPNNVTIKLPMQDEVCCCQFVLVEWLHSFLFSLILRTLQFQAVYTGISEPEVVFIT